MGYELLLYEKTGPVATITLNRPDALNALNPMLEAELHLALDQADADADVRAIILTGAGRAFSAGYDVTPREEPGQPSRHEPAGRDVADFIHVWWTRDKEGPNKLLHLWYLDKPVIAAVNGWAMGGGFWYSLAADITIASEAAVFAQPEVRHISNTTFLFAALAGWKAAHRYSLTGDHIDASEALRLGLVNEVVPADQLLPRARAVAERIAMVPEPSVRINKAVTCWGLLAAGLQAGMMMNIPLSAMAHSSHNSFKAQLMEAMRDGGMRAYLEMRDGPFLPEPFGPKSRVPQGGSAQAPGTGEKADT